MNQLHLQLSVTPTADLVEEDFITTDSAQEMEGNNTTDVGKEISEVSSQEEKEAVTMKERLMSGEDMILKLPEKTEAVSVDESTNNVSPNESTNNVSPAKSTTATSVHVGKEIGEALKETEVDYKNDSEDVKGVKIDDNRVDKNGNKVAVDKVKPPAPKLDEEAARK